MLCTLTFTDGFVHTISLDFAVEIVLTLKHDLLIKFLMYSFRSVSLHFRTYVKIRLLLVCDEITDNSSYSMEDNFLKRILLERVTCYLNITHVT